MKPALRSLTRRNVLILAFTLMTFLFLVMYYQVPLFFEDRYEWHVQMGMKYLQKGSATKAQDFAEKAIEIDHQRIGGYWLLALSCGSLENFSCVRSALAHPSMKSSPGLYYELMGRMELGLGNTGKAIAHFEKLIEATPRKPTGYILLGFIMIEQNNLSAAKKYFELADKLVLAFFERELFVNEVPYSHIEIIFKESLGMVHAGKAIIYEREGNQDMHRQEKEKALEYSPTALEESYQLIS